MLCWRSRVFPFTYFIRDRFWFYTISKRIIFAVQRSNDIKFVSLLELKYIYFFYCQNEAIIFFYKFHLYDRFHRIIDNFDFNYFTICQKFENLWFPLPAVFIIRRVLASVIHCFRSGEFLCYLYEVSTFSDKWNRIKKTGRCNVRFGERIQWKKLYFTRE